jgi:Caspase domain/LCCL domain
MLGPGGPSGIRNAGTTVRRLAFYRIKADTGFEREKIVGMWRSFAALVMAATVLVAAAEGRAQGSGAAPANSGQPGQQAEQGERRVALVIGNSAYRNLGALANPRHDAVAMARQLQESGFELVGGGPQLDLDKAGMERAIQSFGRMLTIGRVMRGGVVGMFYFAGHGVQVRARNFLMPVTAQVDTEAEISLQAVDASLVLEQLEHAGARLSIVVLDACRNNPFPGSQFRSVGNGLAQMSAATGTLVSFSAQPGGLAIDGPADGNSPYTMALLEKMRQPGLNVLDVFNEVGVTVARGTNRMQQPWVSNSPIEGRFYFTPAAAQVAAVQPGQTPAQPGTQSNLVDPNAMDLTFWQSIQNSRNPQAFEEYLRQYPRGRFAGLARIQLDELRRQPGQGNAQPQQQQPQQQSAQPSGADRSALDFAFWQSIQNSRDPAEFEAYLQQFPQGTFAAVARARIEALRGGGQRQQQTAALQPQQTPDPSRGVLGIRACPTDFQTFRDSNASLVCTCSAEAASLSRPIYGSEIYTDDSPVCRAAVHAGAVPADGGTVIVRQRGPQTAFASSNRNGVATLSWPQSSTSFSVARAGDGDAPQGNTQPQQQAQLQQGQQQAQQQQSQQDELRRQQEELRRQQEELRRLQEQQRLAQQQEELRRQQAALLEQQRQQAQQEQQRQAAELQEQQRQAALAEQQRQQALLQQQQQARIPVALPRCPANAVSVRGQLACICTAGMINVNNAVFGTGVYARDSHICRSARHAGVIGPDGGAIIINMVGSRAPTQGSQNNGINSIAYFEPGASFAVTRYSQ